MSLRQCVLLLHISDSESLTIILFWFNVLQSKVIIVSHLPLISLDYIRVWRGFYQIAVDMLPIIKFSKLLYIQKAFLDAVKMLQWLLIVRIKIIRNYEVNYRRKIKILVFAIVCIFTALKIMLVIFEGNQISS